MRFGAVNFGRPAVVFSLTVLMLAPAAGAAPPAASDHCGGAARRYLTHQRALRAADRRIIGWLNAKQYRRAVPALRSAIRHGDPWAADTLGHLYASGLGVRRSAKAAAHWYLWSAQRGNRFAQRRLANAYLNGIGLGRDPALAAYWFRIGVAPFQLAVSDYELALTYASGTLAPANPRKKKYYLDQGLRILRGLAKEPNGAANFYLGLAYAGGHGVARDREKALTYLCRALALGYGPAAPEIGKLQERHHR